MIWVCGMEVWWCGVIRILCSVGCLEIVRNAGVQYKFMFAAYE